EAPGQPPVACTGLDKDTPAPDTSTTPHLRPTTSRDDPRATHVASSPGARRAYHVHESDESRPPMAASPAPGRGKQRWLMPYRPVPTVGLWRDVRHRCSGI